MVMTRIQRFAAPLFALLLALTAALAVYHTVQTPPPQASEAPAVPVPAAPASPRTFSEKIDTGMRAMSLTVADADGGADYLVPGDRVDVLAVTALPQKAGAGGRVSRMLLTDVRVLDVLPEAASGGGNRETRVALTLTPRQAAVLATADPAARLRVIARNPGDDGVAEQPATAFAADGGVQTYARQHRDLLKMISPGMRAITLAVSSNDGVDGIFYPGDRVDVLAVCPWGNLKNKPDSQAKTRVALADTFHNAHTMLQNIRVLATDRSLAWENALNRATTRITLAVSPVDAEKLAVLDDSTSGNAVTLRLVSRDGTDGTLHATRGAALIDLITDKPEPLLRVEKITGARRKHVFTRYE